VILRGDHLLGSGGRVRAGGLPLAAELFRTRVRDGLLGDFSFDARGDITESPITILRVGGGRSSRRIQSIEGGRVEHAVRPRPALVAPR
jgi:hypothetical protein